MGKAIKITAKKAPEGYDLGASKFFGTPTVPLSWDGDFYDDELFFCQIKLSDAHYKIAFAPPLSNPFFRILREFHHICANII